MKNTPDSDYEARARIGVGVSLGAVLGASLAALFSDSSWAVSIGAAVGAGLGAAVGSRAKSQVPQFLWIEYPKNVARRLFFSGLAFVTLIMASIYFIRAGTDRAVQVILLSATSVSGLVIILVVGLTIAQLDDLLKKILLEGIAIGFGLTAFIVLTLGLFSLAFPIRSHWLITFVIMLAAWLLGRLMVAWRYR